MLKLTDLLQSVNDMIIMSVTIMPTQHSLPRTYRQIERSEKGAGSTRIFGSKSTQKYVG